MKSNLKPSQYLSRKQTETRRSNSNGILGKIAVEGNLDIFSNIMERYKKSSNSICSVRGFTNWANIHGTTKIYPIDIDECSELGRIGKQEPSVKPYYAELHKNLR